LRLIWRLNHAIEQRSMAMEAQLGVTAQQRMVIRYIGGHPDLTPGRLAEQMHLDAGTVSATLARLERRGLLVRGRNPVDRRRVTLRLTPAGRVLDKPAAGTVERAVEGMLDRVGPASVRVARRVLITLTELLDAEGGR
jgi:DNA-binding MarR family transcriptional regulator